MCSMPWFFGALRAACARARHGPYGGGTDTVPALHQRPAGSCMAHRSSSCVLSSGLHRTRARQRSGETKKERERHSGFRASGQDLGQDRAVPPPHLGCAGEALSSTQPAPWARWPLVVPYNGADTGLRIVRCMREREDRERLSRWACYGPVLTRRLWVWEHGEELAQSWHLQRTYYGAIWRLSTTNHQPHPRHQPISHHHHPHPPSAPACLQAQHTFFGRPKEVTLEVRPSVHATG